MNSQPVSREPTSPKHHLEAMDRLPEDDARVEPEQVFRECDLEQFKLEGGRILPEHVTGLQAPTKSFLCKLSDNNTFSQIDFVGFKIRDPSVAAGEPGSTLFSISKQPEHEWQPVPEEYDLPAMDVHRSIQYKFGRKFLDLIDVGTTLEFTVGDLNSMASELGLSP